MRKRKLLVIGIVLCITTGLVWGNSSSRSITRAPNFSSLIHGATTTLNTAGEHQCIGDIPPEALCEDSIGRPSFGDGSTVTGDELESATSSSPAPSKALPGNLSVAVDRDRDGIVDKVENEPPTPATATSAQPSIATFDEWTKEKLMRTNHIQAPLIPVVDLKPAGNNGNNAEKTIESTATGGSESSFPVSSAPPAIVSTVSFPDLADSGQRNYAAKDCGAKIINSNPEAENRAAVLNEKEQDEYMRIPCDNANKFLIVELCETVQPTVVELANFEMFSSGPKDVRVWSSERYPTNDWMPMGDLLAHDQRTIQRFVLTNTRNYAKFVKIQLISHHGKEHFCTLSLVRIYGISMVDEYEAEATEVASPLPVPWAVSTPVTEVDTVETNTPAAETMENKPVNRETGLPVNNGEMIPDPTADNRKGSSVIVEKVVKVVEKVISSLPFINPVTSEHHPHRLSIRPVDCCRCNLRMPRYTCSRICRAFGHCSPLQSSRTVAPAIAPVNSTEKKLPVEETTRLSPLILENTSTTISTGPKMPIAENFSKPRDVFLAFLLAPRRQPSLVKKEEIIRLPETIPKEGQSEEATVKAVPLVQPLHIKASPGFESLPGSTHTKESVFKKLHARLRSLELNISLSSEYLNQLSRQYVAQMDEMKKAGDRTARAANETHSALQKLVDSTTAQLQEMRKQLSEMRKYMLKQQLMQRREAAGHSAVNNNHPPAVFCPRNNRNTDRSSPMDQFSYYEHPEWFTRNRISTRSFDEQCLLSEKGMWTMEQLVAIVVLVQLITVGLVLLYVHGIRGGGRKPREMQVNPAVSIVPADQEKSTTEQLERLVDEKLATLREELVALRRINEFPKSHRRPKKKRQRRATPGQEFPLNDDDGVDSAMEASTTTAASDDLLLSSELDLASCSSRKASEADDSRMVSGQDSGRTLRNDIIPFGLPLAVDIIEAKPSNAINDRLDLRWSHPPLSISPKHQTTTPMSNLATPTWKRPTKSWQLTKPIRKRKHHSSSSSAVHPSDIFLKENMFRVLGSPDRAFNSANG